MKETVHTLTPELKLSISSERDDKYKLVYNHGERFIYVGEDAMQTIIDIVED